MPSTRSSLKLPLLLLLSVLQTDRQTYIRRKDKGRRGGGGSGKREGEA
jgi:hypothetical protein